MTVKRRRSWSSPRWGHCRGLTNRIISIVVTATKPDGISRRAWRKRIVTSRKRWATYGNPGSDHHKSQRTADAVDFAFANAFGLRDKVLRELDYDGPVSDYANITVYHRGFLKRRRAFRLQPIAGTHGIGPHLHMGVRAL